MGGYLERLKSKKTATHGTAKTAKRPFDSKDSEWGRHISEIPASKPSPARNIPAPEPPGMGPEYNRTWNQAWELADYIDNPDGAPIDERRARSPELLALRDRLAEIERQAVLDPEPSSPGTWMPWESIDTARDRTSDSCPARCRRSGKCYALAYFKGRAGKPKDCEPETCIWEGGNK